MPSSILNEPPEQPPKKGGDKDRASNYKPQYDVTGQTVNFRAEGEGLGLCVDMHHIVQYVWHPRTVCMATTT
jgi:hypothetical protein